MRRTLTAAALLGVFVIAPAGSAFATPAGGYPPGNCGFNASNSADSFRNLNQVGGEGDTALRGFGGMAKGACPSGNVDVVVTVAPEGPPT